jgi:iron complex transport system ATP-binding protein
MFSCNNLSYTVSGRKLLDDINVCFEANKITAIIGANGAGKSTLFAALLGELKLDNSSVLFNGRMLTSYHVSELAKQRAYVAQHHRLAFSLPVFEYLLMAREHVNESLDNAYKIVQKTCADFQILHLLKQDITRLSGGEAQLIEFTRAYLQICDKRQLLNKCLLLDEPASALDIKQTKRLYQHILMFKEQGGTVILIDHDVNAMASIADNIVLIKEAKILASGPSKKVFIEPLLNDCFDVKGTLYQPAQLSSTSINPLLQSKSHHEQSPKTDALRRFKPIFHVDI